MRTLKAGCFLINKKTGKIALVYRAKRSDFSFPRGHVEEGETLEQCAVRETAEESQRVAKIVENMKPYVEKYTTPGGEKCKCYMYVAFDAGKSKNPIEESHEAYWAELDEVESKLSYPTIRKMWRKAKRKIEKLLK